MAATLKRPVVGMFVDKEIVNFLRTKRAIPLYRINKLVEAAGAVNVTLIIFSVADISFNPDRLRGMGYDHKLQRWKEISCERPDILYDRFVGATPGQVHYANHIREELIKRGVKKINSRHYFDKLEVYQILARNENTSPYLPLTKPLNSFNDIKDMFRKSRNLYFKSTTGRRGKQVISATRLPEAGYAYSYFNEKLFSGRVQNITDLLKVIHSVTGQKKVIVQQGINLLKVNNHIIDFRGELQRNGRGELEIVAILVRLGEFGSPIATHGNSYLFEEFLAGSKLLTNSLNPLKRKVERFLISVYHSMEEAYGPFGEIAIDFGLDQSGRIWFFECNAKSMKVSLCKAADSKTEKKAFLNPLLYARYLYYQDKLD